ncbi:histidinol dehydrogenase, partial [Candidatus Hodgkinia cicadicola]
MFGSVDSLAGPSKGVGVIVIDKFANAWTSSIDLASKLEHDKQSMAVVLITKTAKSASIIRSNIISLLRFVSIKHILCYSWSSYGITIICHDSISLINMLITRTRTLATLHKNPFKMLNKINKINAGAVFIGKTPIAIGDYIAGPTGPRYTLSSSRFRSGLSIDFYKKTSFVYLKIFIINNDCLYVYICRPISGPIELLVFMYIIKYLLKFRSNIDIKKNQLSVVTNFIEKKNINLDQQSNNT